MVVCGGAALNVLGFVKRTTQDVDVIAFVRKDKQGKILLTKAEPLPSDLVEVTERVGRDFNLPENWLNAGPAAIMDLGLPLGLMERVETYEYGNNLIIHFLSRYDQIHFKLYAVIDQSAGKHLDDLLTLKPSSLELEKAIFWSMSHDPSEGYRLVLKDFLTKAGYQDVADSISDCRVSNNIVPLVYGNLRDDDRGFSLKPVLQDLKQTEPAGSIEGLQT